MPANPGGRFWYCALVKGEFKITRKRVVSGQVSRVLGVLLLIGAGASFLFRDGVLIMLGLLVIVIIIGLATSQKIEEAPPETTEEPPAAGSELER